MFWQRNPGPSLESIDARLRALELSAVSRFAAGEIERPIPRSRPDITLADALERLGRTIERVEREKQCQTEAAAGD